MRGSLYELKPRFQALLRPAVAALARAGVSANQITVLALSLSLAWGASALWLTPTPLLLLLLPGLMLLRMALNAVDGMLAREHDMRSALGGLLNELSDVASDAAIYLPFALLPSVNAPLLVTLVILALISEMTGVVCQSLGASRRYDGPMGKSDRALVFGAFALVLGLGVPQGLWVNILLAIVAVLTVLTILNRARRGLAEIAPK